MLAFQLAAVILMGLSIFFLLILILKSILTPRKIESIQKLIKQGKYPAAVKTAKSIIAKNPRDFKAHYYLGQAYLLDDKPELALMEYKIVNQTAIFDSTFSEAEFRKQIAQLYYKYNQPEEALKEYLLLIKLEPHISEHYFNAGKIFEARSQSAQALAHYQKAVALDKKNVKAHAAIGLLLYRAKQYIEAKKAIDYAISLSPQTYSTYYYLGKILKEGKDHAGAVRAFEKAMRDTEYRQRALIECGTSYMETNQIEKAIIEFDRAISSASDNSRETLYARYFLAACYEKERNIEKALEQWGIIYTANPTFRDVPAKLAQYRDLHTNDNMKEYLTSNAEYFVEICKKIALYGYNLSPRSVKIKNYGCMFIATESKSENWQTVRQQINIMFFHREPDLITDTFLRQQLEEMEKQNFVRCIICTSAGFTRSSMEFAENRPFELVGKDKLEAILEKIKL